MKYSSFTFKTKGIYKTTALVRCYSTNTNKISKVDAKVDLTLKDDVRIKDINLNPWFVTGLSDGDGSFYITLRKDSTCRFGYSVSLEYKVVAGINPLNLKLLELVQSFFDGDGLISKDNNTYHYVIRNRNHLRKVLNHFYNYPLQTTKHIHFLLWSKVLDLIERKEHSTLTGFMEVVAIKSVFPTGMKDSVKAAFPDVNPIIKPEFLDNSYELNGHWIAGFTQADGSFGLNFYKVPAMRLGYSCRPCLRITQHKRDLIVLKRILEYFGCGILIKCPSKSKSAENLVYDINISKFSDIVNIVIPFFQQYAIYGAKHADFLDFKKGVSIVNNKGHFTPEGLNQIKNLTYGMNSFRKF